MSMATPATPRTLLVPSGVRALASLKPSVYLAALDTSVREPASQIAVLRLRTTGAGDESLELAGHWTSSSPAPVCVRVRDGKILTCHAQGATVWQAPDGEADGKLTEITKMQLGDDAGCHDAAWGASGDVVLAAAGSRGAALWTLKPDGGGASVAYGPTAGSAVAAPCAAACFAEGDIGGGNVFWAAHGTDVGLFDPRRDEKLGPALLLARAHAPGCSVTTVSSPGTSSAAATTLVSAGSDGYIRYWDARVPSDAGGAAGARTSSPVVELSAHAPHSVSRIVRHGDHASLWASCGSDGRACLFHLPNLAAGTSSSSSSSSSGEPCYASACHDDACVGVCWDVASEGAGWGWLSASADGLVVRHHVSRKVKYDVLL